MSGTPMPAAGCEWLAQKRGWTLRRGNVMVEGDSDVGYFELASRLHRDATGNRLLGQDLSVFSAGQGDEGGTYGISERFPTLFEMAGLDLDQAGNRRYHVIALVDDDAMGRSAVNGITKGHRRIVEHESIFRLRRVMPLRAGSARVLSEQFKQANGPYKDLTCVIEDLLPVALCERYLAETPSATSRPPVASGGGKVFSWTPAGKSGLLRFTKAQATAGDVGALVGVLRALRSYVGLTPDGI